MQKFIKTYKVNSMQGQQSNLISQEMNKMINKLKKDWVFISDFLENPCKIIDESLLTKEESKLLTICHINDLINFRQIKFKKDIAKNIQ